MSESFKNKWNEVIKSIDGGHHFDNVSDTLIEDYVKKHTPFIQQILKNTHKNRLNNIIEIGFGRGLIATYLSYQDNICVFGMEKNPGYVKLALATSDYFNGNLIKDNFIIGDLYNIDINQFQPGRFDIMYNQGVLHHFKDYIIRMFIDEILTISDVVVFSVPSYAHPHNDNVFRKPSGYFFEDEAERFLRIEDWVKILKKYKSSMFYYSHSPDNSSEIIKNMSICITVR